MNFLQEEFNFDPPRSLTWKSQWKVVPVGVEAALPAYPIDTPEACARYWHEQVATSWSHDPEVEWVVVITLNTRLFPKGHQVIAQGTVNETTLHPREVFRAAIVASGFCVVLMHNHPSGDPSPSAADRNMTRRIREAGQLLRIELLDHVIMGSDQPFSFREAGLLH